MLVGARQCRALSEYGYSRSQLLDQDQLKF
jgi:hypothetical protein